MENIFKEIQPEEISENPFKLLDLDWMLITAGNLNNFNTMTASWGGFGVLWNRKIAICFIRPQRYTFQFVEKNDLFSLCFFEETHRDILNYCGSNSGKNVNKIESTGLLPFYTKNNCIAYKQSKLIIDCRKIYSDVLKNSHFIDKMIPHEIYPTNDFHHIYIGEILQCYIK